MTARVTALANGFRVATDFMPGFDSVNGGIWIRNGASRDPIGKEGTAHFTEHMVLRGTELRTAREISDSIEMFGGELAAYTESETTCFGFSSLREHVPAAVGACAEIIRRPLLDPEDLETEREVILHELQMEDDSPMERVIELARRRAYPDDPFGRPLGGTPESMAAIGGGDVAEFIRRNYVPGRMILSAAGAVDHDALVKQAEALFGDMDAVDGEERAAPRFAGGEIAEEAPSSQIHMALAVEGPTLMSPPAEMYAGMIYAMALGGSSASRLYEGARERLGLCYDIAAWLEPSSMAGSLVVASATGPSGIGDLVKAVIGEIRRPAEDFGAEELDRFRTRLRSGLRMDMESPASRAERMGRMLAVLGRVPPMEETIADVDSVTLPAVRDLIGKMAEEAPMALALLGPIGEADGIPGLEGLLGRRPG